MLRSALGALERHLESPNGTGGSLQASFDALVERVEAVLDEEELPTTVAEGYRRRHQAWKEEAATNKPAAALALRALVSSAHRIVRRIRSRDDPASLDALPLPKDGADRLSAAQRTFLLDRLCHPAPPWALLDRIPIQLLGGTDPISLALARLREIRGPGSSGQYGDRPADPEQRLDAVHRWVLERAPHEPLGVFRLIVEEAHRGTTEIEHILPRLVLLDERVTDPWVRDDQGAIATALSARIQLYQAMHFDSAGLHEDAEAVLEEVDRLLRAQDIPDPELKAATAAFHGKRAARTSHPDMAHRYYRVAVITALGKGLNDRGVELLNEWLRGSLRLSLKPVDLIPALKPLWRCQATEPVDHRPLERLEVYRLAAGTLWAGCISSIIEPLRGTSVEELTGAGVLRALEGHSATLEHLGRAAHTASPLVMRHPLPARHQVLVYQWWARSLVVRDPQAAVTLLVRAAEQCLAEEQHETLLQVLLDMVWPLLLSGQSGAELLLSEPLTRLLGSRPALSHSFHRLLEGLIRGRESEDTEPVNLGTKSSPPDAGGGLLH